MIRAARLLLLAPLLGLLGMGCSQPDPCGGYSGTCVAVEVRADTDRQISTLEVTLRLGERPAVRQTTSPPSGATGFPLLFPVQAGDFAGDLQIAVASPELNLAADGKVTLVQGEHRQLSLTLAQPGAAPDMGGGDLPPADLAPAVLSPSARFGAALATFPPRNSVLLFGGTSERNVSLGDTWEWNGRAWAESPQATPPASRTGAALAYDPARTALVLFGGASGGASLGDVAMLDRTGRWTRMTTTNTPPARAGAAFAYSGAAGALVLAGGVTVENDSPLFDVWELASGGLAWVQRAGVTALPVKMRGHALVTGPNNILILVGTETATTTVRLWLYNPTTPAWTPLTPTGDAPAARREMVAAYDPLQNGIVVSGGATLDATQGLDDTFIYLIKDNRWVPITSAERPAARRQAAGDFDPVLQSVLLFGGRPTGIISRNFFGDTWLLESAKAWRALIR